MKYLDELERKAREATPGPYEARCRDFSNRAPLEVWTEYGWADQLPRQYREPTYEFFAAANPSVVLDLIEKLRKAEKAIFTGLRAARGEG